MMTQPAGPPSDMAPNGEPRAPRGPASHELARHPAETAGSRPDAATGPHIGYVWLWLLLIAVSTAGWYYHDRWLPFAVPGWVKNSASPTKGGGAKAIPVRTALVQQRDMPVFIKGLGTVTAFKTVTLRSRVDGELVKVAFTEGQMVREDDLLAQIDPRPFQSMLEQAQGTLAKDQATLELAKITLQRAKELLKRNSISQQEVDQDAAQVQTIEGTVQTDQALVANAKLQLTYCRIVAPISGRIGLRLVDQGNIVHANDLTGMAVITQLQPISLVFPVSQDDIPRVQKQMNGGATLTVYAYDRNNKTILATGKLAAVDNQVDSTTGTVKLKAVFDNDDGMLFPNQFVNAQLLVDTNRDAVVVPSASVQRGPTYAYVYVVQDDAKEKVEKVKLREVQVGLTEGPDTAISSGLVPGEIVVTDGIDKLKDGTVVSTKESKDSSSRVPTAVASTGAAEKQTEAARPAAVHKDAESAPGPKGAQ